MDEDRFRGLFDAHYGLVVAYSRRRGATWDDAHDVAAEVFAVAWRRRDAIPLDAERPWLLGVTRRLLANQKRGLRRRLRLVERVGWSTPHSTAASATEATAGTDPVLTDALECLAEHDREVLRLIAWEQLSYLEVAALLDLTPSAVASRVSRARQRLRRAIDARTAVPSGGA